MRSLARDLRGFNGLKEHYEHHIIGYCIFRQRHKSEFYRFFDAILYQYCEVTGSMGENLRNHGIFLFGNRFV